MARQMPMLRHLCHGALMAQLTIPQWLLQDNLTNSLQA
jgi:hypothetical protein